MASAAAACRSIPRSHGFENHRKNPLELTYPDDVELIFAGELNRVVESLDRHCHVFQLIDLWAKLRRC